MDQSQPIWLPSCTVKEHFRAKNGSPVDRKDTMDLNILELNQYKKWKK
jgi:hypothetical protein